MSEKPRLFFDVTKYARQSHHSGLNRVTGALLRELKPTLGDRLVPVAWNGRRRCFVEIDTGLFLKARAEMAAQDWWLTPEVFCPSERRGFDQWLREVRVRRAAIFHDAIPLRYPETTWPQSVRRFPDYLEMLRRFDQVFCVSHAAKQDLLAFSPNEPDAQTALQRKIEVLHLGGDGFLEASTVGEVPPDEVRLISIGIIEPRKNAHRLLEASRRLWAEGLSFRLTFVGRVNPRFGREIYEQIEETARQGHTVDLYRKFDDARLAKLLPSVTWSVFASRAEGFGLPVLESLHAGVPVIAAPVPSVVELQLGENEGVLRLDPPRVDPLVDVLRRAITDRQLQAAFRQRAVQTRLPSWQETAGKLQHALGL